MQSATPTQPQKQPHLQTPPQASPQSSAEFRIRPTLPDRNVTADSIEDAYVQFVFYCNPALPLTAETASLREAFRNPPRSGGKSFNTFTVFELVRKFYDKEIRTWTELTTKLGVEPPDPSKDESAQKIAQYGVRLKKWMNSMHVKAFFEYLMNIPNDYWTNIPADPNPVGQAIRDGVAIEDDMALRALLPHIRPKRGRKRPADDEASVSPAQRTHLSPMSAIEDAKRSSVGLQVPADTLATPWTPSDAVQQMPLTRWPQSAITPTTCRGTFWDDTMEPRSAILPSKPRLGAQRRGPKNVSSAWRPGASDGAGKTRGRPPINRTPIDATFPPFPSATPIVGPGEARSPVLPTPTRSKLAESTAVQHPIPSPAPSANSQGQSTPQEGARPPRPSISLQVPTRPSGSVRLATPPPPVVIINGDTNDIPTESPPVSAGINGRMEFSQAMRQAGMPEKQPTPPQSKDIPRFYFERTEDRTNIDHVLGHLTRATLEADWRDINGQPTDPPSVEEASALINTAVENMYKKAVSPQAFLINLVTITGGGLLRTSTTRITRMGVNGEFALYRCEWEYGFGPIRAPFSMKQQVPLAMFSDLSGDSNEATPEPVGGEQGKLSADEWKEKYRHLLDSVQKKDRELFNLRSRVVESLRGEAPKE